MPLDSIDLKDLTSIVEGIARGEYHLLLGAGSSIGGTGGDGRKIPDGKTLATQIAEDFGIDTEGELIDLKTAYELAEKRLANGAGRADYIRKRFSTCQPSWQETLTSFRWWRIWTLNIDDVVEQSYSLHPQSSQAPYSYTWVDPYTDPAKDKDAQGKEELQIIHLHGYAGVPTGRDPQLVFSILEYLQAYSARYAWHRVFGDTFYQRPFLVVGARLTDEWDLMEFLSRGTASRESTGRPSLIVLRDISTIQREQLTRYGLVPIQMDATQFFEELRQRVQPREEQLLQLPHGRGRIETPGRIFLQQFQWLRLDAAEIEPRNHDFYDGDDPIWSDILAARDANFEITTRTLAKIRAEISDPHPKQLIYCLSGPPGSGKSTVLLRLAKELITDGVDLYSFRAEERLDIPAVLWWLQRLPKCVLLFDGLADFAHEVQQAAAEAHKAGIVLLILATERESRFRQISGVVDGAFLVGGADFRFGLLSDNDIVELVRKRESARRLGKLTQRSRDQRIDFFRRIAKRQLFAGLMDLEGAPGFIGKLRSEYEKDLNNESSRRLYALAAMSYSLGYPLPLGIGQTAAGIDAIEMSALLKGPFSSICVLDRRGLRPRHRVIASTLIERILDQDQRFEISLLLAKAIAPYITVHTIRQRTLPYRIVRSLMDKDVIKSWLGETRAHDWYESLRDEYDWNARFWEQRALLESDRKDYPKARSFAEYAVTIQRHTFTENTLGTILMRMAIDYLVPGTSEADRIFWEAVLHLRESRELGRGQFLHPYTTFFSHAIRFAKVAFDRVAIDPRLLSEWNHWRDQAKDEGILSYTEGQRQLEQYQREWLSLATSQPEQS